MKLDKEDKKTLFWSITGLIGVAVLFVFCWGIFALALSEVLKPENVGKYIGDVQKAIDGAKK